MGYATIEDRVDRLEALFGQFMASVALMDKHAEARNKQAEERFNRAEQRAEERNKLAEERSQAGEERQKRAEERAQALEMLAEERHQSAEERHKRAEKRAEERNRLAEERFLRAEKRSEESNRLAEERHQAAELRHKADQESFALFRQDMRQSKRELDKKWGDLANKMGTIIEDILAPNLRRLAFEHFGMTEVLDFMIRRTRRHPERAGVFCEFDTLVVGLDTVILGEAKSTPSLGYVNDFAEKIQRFYEFFPEFLGRRLVAVFESWAMPDALVEALTARGIYAMRMGEDTMELANAAELEKDAS
jgi:hypothetical protein